MQFNLRGGQEHLGDLIIQMPEEIAFKREGNWFANELLSD
jgi:hypothetical protein